MTFFTRDIIQGFIDGYVSGGGDPSVLPQALNDYLNNHPTYNAEKIEKDSIVNDIKSYRISTQDVLSPSLAKVAPQ